MDINQVLTVRKRNSGVISHLRLVVDNESLALLPSPLLRDDGSFDFKRLDERTNAA